MNHIHTIIEFATVVNVKFRHRIFRDDVTTIYRLPTYAAVGVESFSRST